MSRRKKDPLRELTDRRAAGTDPAQPVAGRPGRRGHPGQAPPGRRRAATTTRHAARSVGRRSGDAVSHLVARFNAEGLAALTPRHGGGRRPTYGPAGPGADRRPRPPGRRPPRPTAPRPGRSRPCARTLRAAPDGLPRVSTYTIWRVLHEAGSSYQRTRTWCPTGTALRRRKAGPAVVTDPDAEAKKS